MRTTIKDIRLPLGDILDLRTVRPESLASARVSVLDLLLVSAQLANKQAGNFLNLNAALPSLNLGGVGGIGLDVQLKVIEAPQIAIARPEDSFEQRTARTSQVALRVHLFVNVLNLAKINLPLYLEAASGQATLQQALCDADVSRCRVDLQAQTSPLTLCISSAPLSTFKASDSCGLTTTLAELNVLGLVGVNLDYAPPSGKQARQNATSSNLTYQGYVDDNRDGRMDELAVMGSTQSVNSGLSGTIGSLINALNVVGDLRVDMTGLVGGLLGFLLEPLLNTTLASVTAILQGLLGLVNTVLSPLLDGVLQLLGLAINKADVRQIQLICNNAELVN